MLNTLLKPVNKEQVLKRIKELNEYGDFLNARRQYKDLYDEEIPEEYKPFKFILLQKLGINIDDLYYYNHTYEFEFKKNNTRICVTIFKDKNCFNMFPYRKIYQLKHINAGSIYWIGNLEDFNVFMNFLDNLK